jgi:hypothetical protein
MNDVCNQYAMELGLNDLIYVVYAREAGSALFGK